MKLDLSNHEINKIVVDYINSKIGIGKLLPESEEYFSEFSLKYTNEQMFHGIDIAAIKYLKIQNNVVDSSSVGIFLNKITGVIRLEEKPLEQKIYYIIGIMKNKFAKSNRYMNNKDASIILKKLIKTLNKFNYNEKEVLEYLDERVIPITKECYCWSQWTNILNSFMEEVTALNTW